MHLCRRENIDFQKKLTVAEVNFNGETETENNMTDQSKSPPIYTRGEWAVDGIEDICLKDPNGFRLHICRVSGEHTGEEQAEGDLRLIAASVNAFQRIADRLGLNAVLLAEQYATLTKTALDILQDIIALPANDAGERIVPPVFLDEAHGLVKGAQP
jgi:hypothetical protein